MTKRLLMIANGYPPHAGPEAARCSQLAKYLPRHGWEPYIICSDWTEHNCRMFDPGFGSTASEFVARRVAAPRDLTVPRSVSDYIEKVQRACDGYANPRHWTRSVIKAARSVANEKKIDVVWATYPMRGALYAAKIIAKEIAAPWIADFRDVYEQGRRPSYLWRWERWNECRTVRSAQLITTVSGGLAEILRQRHSQEVRCLPNGFDPEDFASVQPQRSGKFTILYSGAIHPVGCRARASPRLLLEAIDSLCNYGKLRWEDVDVHFVGTPRQLVSAHTEGCESRKIVRVTEWVPRSEARSLQCGASVLLLLGSSEMKGILTSKIFEYLAAGRRILAIPSDGDCIDELLRTSGAGQSAQTVTQVASIIERWYREWKSSGELSANTDKSVVDSYDRARQAGILAKWLDEIDGRSAMEPLPAQLESTKAVI